MSLNFRQRQELFFGKVSSYDRELLVVEEGNVKPKRILALAPGSIKGTTHLFPGDFVALWEKGTVWQARLLRKDEYGNLKKKLNLSDPCTCCFHSAQRKS